MKSLRLGVALAALALPAAEASAIDMAPGDYTVLPAGTTLALFYLQHMYADELNVDGVGSIPDSELGVAVGIARVVHYSEFAGVPFALQAFLPFGGFTTAEVGGASVPTSEGLGDLVLGATIYPINHVDNPLYQTTIGFTQFLTLPTGAHDIGDVSFGGGATVLTSQLGLIQGLGAGFFLDASADVSFTLDHDESIGTYSYDPAVHAQAYLRYQFSPATMVAFGYSGIYGGDLYIDDVFAGNGTEVHELRAFASTFLTETLQIQGMVATDLDVDDGFENAISTELRVLAAF